MTCPTISSQLGCPGWPHTPKNHFQTASASPAPLPAGHTLHATHRITVNSKEQNARAVLYIHSKTQCLCGTGNAVGPGHQHPHLKGMRATETRWSHTRPLAQAEAFPVLHTQLKTWCANSETSSYPSSATRKQNLSRSQQHSPALAACLCDSEKPVPFSKAAQTHITFSWERISICGLSLTTASAQHLPVSLPLTVSREWGHLNFLCCKDLHILRIWNEKYLRGVLSQRGRYIRNNFSW